MSAYYEDVPSSFEDALRSARRILSKNRELLRRGVVDAEAELLVLAAYRKASGKSLDRAGLYAHLRDRYPAPAAMFLLMMAGARAEGKPLQHLTGWQVFLDHEYEVGPDGLIPRPETEGLVLAAWEEMTALKEGPDLGLEIGIGSGVISVELLTRFSGLRMIASEFSERAAVRAAANARRILGDAGAGRLKIVMSADARTVFDAFRQDVPEGSADYVVMNPPYMSPTDEIDADVAAYEPREALFAPPDDVLYFYREAACNARKFLRKSGMLFAEIPHERAGDIEKLFLCEGWEAVLLKDLSGRDRVLKLRS